MVALNGDDFSWSFGPVPEPKTGSGLSSLLLFAAVSIITPRKIKTEMDENTSINPEATWSFTSCAY
ncbi:unnamed protein product [Thlaspi arvense]|uniref:Uncharacterized protein n=1 Tax=Thlaspi arvense TaxID=13288 RepID=A0AAU9RRB2_THLAR|nr:unnamed protein product [Thlaspi arvense]